MKKELFLLTAIFVSSITLGQTITENYIHTTTYQTETSTGIVSSDDKIESITYFDGLGRTKQSIAKQAGGLKQDIITPMVYDYFGRQEKDYLPYARANSTLNYELQGVTFFNNLNAQYEAKFPNDVDSSLPNPFSEKYFEFSPLNRVLEQAAHGKDWSLSNGHTIKFDYQFNGFQETKYFKVDFIGDDTLMPFLVFDNYYKENVLHKTITKDENWTSAEGLNHTMEEFKDKEGRIVLKRTYADVDLNNDGDTADDGELQAPHETYYVYDDFGNLTFVIPPLATDNLLEEVIVPGQPDPVPFTQTIPASQFTTNGSGLGQVTFGVTDIGNSTFEYKITTSLSGLSSRLKTGFITTLPNASGVPDGPLFYIYGQELGGNEYYLFKVINGDLYIDLMGPTFSIWQSINETNTFILPSGMASTTELQPNQDILAGLCYQYKYDDRNRLVEKKIPGKGWEHIVYDKLDRPVLTQDSELSLSNHWLFTKYDVFDRIVYSGKYYYEPSGSLSNSGRIELQEAVNSQASFSENKLNTAHSIELNEPLYYSNDIFPNSNIEINIVNYYDGYIFDKISGNSENSYDISPITNPKGLPTGSKIRVIGTNDWITNVNYYNEKSMLIYSYSFNDYLNTTDKIKSKLDFIGKVEETTAVHLRNGHSTITTVDTFTYDHAGRLITQKQKINNLKEELIVLNTYDEFGQLENKKVGGDVASTIESSTGLQTVNYTYNIRGWLKQINDPAILGTDLFGFKINYNSLDYGGTKLYNGNISETIWKTSNDNNLRGYGYAYDALNRINVANYHGNYMVQGLTAIEDYSLNQVNYDKNGNITNLQRMGLIGSYNPTGVGLIDDLNYSYSTMSNKLISVQDTATEEGYKDSNITLDDYVYDSNGNMIKDKNKNITTIEYNHLNLPTYIHFDNPSTMPDGSISYKYDAIGNKIEKSVTLIGSGTTSTIYAGNYIYEDRSQTIVGGTTYTSDLKFFNHSEGYVEPNGSGGFNYIYQYKDHLGNIRLSYKKDNAEVDIDDFNNGTTGSWGAYASIISNENNQLKVVLSDPEVGIYKTISVTAGEELNISLDLDTGSTDKVSLYNFDTGKIANLVDGYNQISYTPTISGDLFLLLVKDPASNDVGTQTYFYLDNFEIIIGEDKLVIQEENNYYPFGLKHKGYNNIVNGIENNYLTFNGVEHEESLGLNIYEMDVRQYDPAIARFTSLDPVTHFFSSPYSAFDNNPVVWSDPSGADASKLINDIWNNSGSGSTTWTNNNDGTFGDGNGNSVDCDDCQGVQLYETAKYNNTLPNYDESRANEAITVGDYSLTPYYKDGAIVAYGAARGNRLEYIIAAGSVGAFQENAFIYTTAANLFYINGYAPDENTIALSQGNLNGLAGMWKDALSSPEYYLYVATVLVGGAKVNVNKGAVEGNFRRFIKKAPANSKASATMTPLGNSGNYLFEATSPGKVPGSRAVYQKWVNNKGETYRMLKTTYTPEGKVIHVKPKY